MIDIHKNSQHIDFQLNIYKKHVHNQGTSITI
jgi:hypothetical protein